MDDTVAAVRIQNQLSDMFNISKGLKQGDGLAPTLFNLALEYVIRQMDIGKENLLTNKTLQVAAYADDINIMSRRAEAARQAYSELKLHAKNIGLEINSTKTKTLIQKRDNRAARMVVEDNIESVDQFVYLGVELNSAGTEDGEIRRRITIANKAYFAMSHVLKSKNVHRNNKLRVYKTIIRPIASYGSEAWTMTERTKNMLNIFERKVLRKILGPVKDDNIWRTRFNYELYSLFKEPPLS